MPQTVRIAAISGSLRRDSHNTRLLRFVAGRIGGDAAGGAVEIDEISLLDLDLPMMNEDLEREQGHPPAVLELKRRMIAADALLFASPEYNGSLTPALKNAIDWATRPREDEAPLACFKGKVTGLLSASPGVLGGLRGLRHLRLILNQIGAIVLPGEYALASCHEGFDGQGWLKNENAARLAVGVGEAVVKTARALKSAG